MGAIEPLKSPGPIGQHLPQRNPEPPPPASQPHSWKRYLLPVLLVAMALTINVLAYLTPPKEAAIPAQQETVATMDIQAKVDAAQALRERADKNYDDGGAITNYLKWKDFWTAARNDYEEAWRLITNVDYPAGFDDKYLIVQSVQCRTLHKHLKDRLDTIQAKLE
ncbi:MAG: hypothetical protein HYV27_22990 [Candidatus Hydrogenedentes bacterium]|nr:hypothetical protein [Candidatus Hydrogenedentota bacterium]